MHRGGVICSSDEIFVMKMERRNGIVPLVKRQPTSHGMSDASQAKSFEIDKREIVSAYKRVRKNKGAAGCDGESVEDFDQHLTKNLYKIWNRLSSGSYLPPPVKRVEIPKDDGGTRPLGIPTVSDRIAQMVIKQRLEPVLEKLFHPNSYGYRPNKSALDAIGLARERCWKRAWVLDMDIKGFFDNIDHDLLMRAVEKHVKEKWIRLYIVRWLKAAVLHPDGRLETTEKGTPQGGVISPLLANLYLHYVFDVWIEKRWYGIEFERYADDIVCHCSSEREAKKLKDILTKRFSDCELTLHPAKTKIAYCRSEKFTQDYPIVSFEFLGHVFKPKVIKTKAGMFRVNFLPSIKKKAAVRIRQLIKSWHVFSVHDSDLMTIANHKRTVLQGWINYYGKYGRREIIKTLYFLDREVIRWAKRKYKRLTSTRKARNWLNGIRLREPNLFVHWQFGHQEMIGR